MARVGQTNVNVALLSLTVVVTMATTAKFMVTVEMTLDSV